MTGEKASGRGRFALVCLVAFVVALGVGAASKLLHRPSWAERYSVEWSDAVGTLHADLPYGDGDANRFDLYLPADSSQEGYGLVVYLHAGDFTGGDKSDDAQMLEWLCSKGFVTAGVNYTPRDAQHPGASVHAQSVEVHEAVPEVVAAAEELGYPVDRMAIAGSGSGGCLALLYAYRDAASAPVPVRMVFEAAGTASFNREDWTGAGLDRDAEAAASLFSAMAGAEITPEEVESGAYLDKLRDISAVEWVDATSVPTLMAYGEHDKLTPYLSSVRLDAALTEAGVAHDYIVLPHSGHGLQNDDALYVLYLDKIGEYLERYLGQ